MTQEKDINYWKNNCEEDYITTPISVLRYISELEKIVTSSQTTSDKWKEYQDWLNETPEISDEEIQKAIDAYFPKTDINARWGWKLGAEWYREQLKQK
jgi:hypothetical protein